MDLLADDYLTVGEVAAIFRISPRTVYSWIRRGQLRAVQLGGSWRIPRSQFDQSNAINPTPQEIEA